MKQMQLTLAHKQNNLGFSLIEMVLTIGIIAIIIVALATMGISTLKKAAESNNKSRAIRFAQEAVEGVRYYRDVNKAEFSALKLSKDKDVGNYVLIMGPGDTGWQLQKTDFLGKGQKGCQDPVYDDISGVKTSTECASVLSPYFKRKIEVTNIDTDGNVRFKITVWWENGNDENIKGKKVVMTTTLAQ